MTVLFIYVCFIQIHDYQIWFKYIFKHQGPVSLTLRLIAFFLDEYLVKRPPA